MGEPDANRTGRFVDIRRVAETGSTNRDLLDAAATGAADGTVLVADHQTAGRGRLDRSWTAPPGASLLVSVLLRPTLSADRVFLLTVAAAVAAIDAVSEVAGVRLGLKWPNDLVAVAERDEAGAAGPGADRKVAGILAESLVADGRIDAVVVGMGLNVNWPDPLPEELAGIATSLDRLAGRSVDRDRLLEVWLARYSDELDRLETGDTSALLGWARALSATIGRRVEVELADRTVTGVAVAVSDDGHLVVQPDDGAEPFEVSVGDVVHARLASD